MVQEYQDKKAKIKIERNEHGEKLCSRTYDCLEHFDFGAGISIIQNTGFSVFAEGKEIAGTKADEGEKPAEQEKSQHAKVPAK
jgi:hypothetical protein